MCVRVREQYTAGLIFGNDGKRRKEEAETFTTRTVSLCACQSANGRVTHRLQDSQHPTRRGEVAGSNVSLEPTLRENVAF